MVSQDFAATPSTQQHIIRDLRMRGSQLSEFSRGSQSSEFSIDKEASFSTRVSLIKRRLTDRQKQEKDSSIVNSVWFATAANLLILMNALQMGLEADYPDYKDVWLICENIFTGGFAIEMVIKLCTLKLKYFHDKANVFDCALTLLGIVDCWILAPTKGAASVDLQSLTILRLLRLLRLIRFVRLIRVVKPFVLLIRGVIRAMSTAVYFFALCVSIFYVIAIFLTEHLGKSNTELYPRFSTDPQDIDEQDIMTSYNPYICFGSMLSSMLTLLNMSIMAEWTEIIRPIAIKQPIYLPIFLLFAAFVSFGIMSVLIAAVVNIVTEEAKEMEMEDADQQKQKKLNILEQIEDLLPDIDLNGDGLLDLDELDQSFQFNEKLRTLLGDIDLPGGWSSIEFRNMLDMSGDGVLEPQEFATSLFRLLDSNDFHRVCIMTASINHLKYLVKDQGKRFGALHSTIQSDLASIKAALGIAAERQKTPEDGQLAARAAVETDTAEMSNDKETCSLFEKHVSNSEIRRGEWVGSTHDASDKANVNKFTSRLQLEEALSTALMIVKQAVDEEFAATEPRCKSLVEVAETQSPYHDRPSIEPVQLQSRRQHPTANEFETALPENILPPCRTQLETALSAALMFLKECIRVEFAAIEPCLESEPQRSRAQKCTSPPCHAGPSIGSVQPPAHAVGLSL